MNNTEAMTLLKEMVQWDQKPTLSLDELNLLLVIAAQPDSSSISPALRTVWTAAQVVTLNSEVVPSVYNGYWYKATTAGTNGSTEPEWPTVAASTVVDGTTVWTRQGYAWEPTWRLSVAAAEGWDWKAGKVVSQYDVQAGSVEASRSQIYKHCIAQRNRYRGMAAGGGGIGWITTTTEYA